MAEEVDISKAGNHIVPTVIAENYGTFYVGDLGTFPIDPQHSKVLTLTKEGASGLFCWDLAAGPRRAG